MRLRLLSDMNFGNLQFRENLNAISAILGPNCKRLHAGVSWVLRDSMSNVVLHSRRSYSQVVSLFEAKIKS